MMNSATETQELILSADSLISAHPEQLSSDLDGETILLQMSSGLYYGLNEMGAAIWEMIQTPISFGSLQAKLLEAYDVEAGVCEQEVSKLLSELHGANLIEVNTAEAR